ncbi:hypothetical protein ES703_105149 [subsurface metagenome]
MEIKKAIEILTGEYAHLCCRHDLDLRDAIKLGAEALNRVQEGRQAHPEFSRLRLPGETS